MLLIVSAPKRAEAGACPVLTWGGQSWNTNWSPTTKKLSGTAVFNNWAGTQYNITINWEGPKPGCVTQAEFTKSMNWLYNSDAQTFWNKNVDNWTQYLTCGNTHTYSRTHVPVAGVCGVADGATYSSTPDSGLCSVGGASAVTTNASTYTWKCSGQYGGTNDVCSADKSNNGGTNNTGANNNGGGNNTGATLTDARCDVSNTLPNLGETVSVQAIPVGGSTYSYVWTNVTSVEGSTAIVTKSSASLVTPSVSITSGGITKNPTCSSIEFSARPTISIVPPITDNLCTLNWNIGSIPGATCQVFADGVFQAGVNNGSTVNAGKKYQIKCTYTPEGTTISTTTVSAIRACVKNPSLIEI